MAANHLPHQLTSFIGREAEITQITARLNAPDCRLLTLVGMGGSGKTRLAIEAAERQTEIFGDGIWFVPLQPLQFSTQVVAAILDALPIQVSSEPHTQLLNFLRDKRLLLILDNFEHLLESVHFVSEIIASAPQVKILVTSREVLNLQEEWVQSVEGMSYPDAQPAAGLKQYDAVRLFGERAGQVRHTFALDQELESVLRICRLVDGLPLALELAAGWTKALSCQAIAVELQRGSHILSSDRRNIPTRHSSIRVVLEHTWRRLDNEEQVVFRRLAVFRGGFTREAAQQVAGASLHVLARLVDQSLIKRSADDRYDLHELLRQYAAEQLEAAGESERIHDAHSEYFLDFVATHTGVMYGPNMKPHLDEVERDFDNIRAAWYQAVANRNADAISRAVECLTWFCDRRCRVIEHEELYSLAQERFAPAEGEQPALVWGQLVVRRASILHYEIFIDEGILARQLHQAGLEAAHSHEDPFEIAFATYRWGDFLVRKANLDAITPLEQGLTLFQQMRNEFYMSECLIWIGIHYHNLNDVERCLHYTKLAIELKLRLGDKSGAGWSLLYASITYHNSGYIAEAEAAIEQAQHLLAEIQSPIGLTTVLRNQAVWKFWQGDFEEAQFLAAKALRHAPHIQLPYEKASITFILIWINFIVDEDYQRAMTAWEQSRPAAYTDPDDAPPWGILCGLEHYEEAKKRFPVLLCEFASRPYADVVASITFVAIIVANQGEEEFAAELFGLVFAQHPAYIGWVHRWPLVTRLLARLSDTLGVERYEALRERGKRLDVLTVAAELCVRFKAELQGGASQVQPSSPDALTDRELDVLRLLAQGHSNREIAEQLVLAVGTIKGYVYNICQKLGAQNRTQAIIRARQLNLL